MNTSIKNLNQKSYKLLIRKLRKEKEKLNREKTDIKKTDSNQSK